MNHRSFSIGIIEIVTSNTNQNSICEDPKLANNGSKSLHILTMAKQSLKKSKIKKEAHPKTPKKRGRKVVIATSRPALSSVCIYFYLFL